MKITQVSQSGTDQNLDFQPESVKNKLSNKAIKVKVLWLVLNHFFSPRKLQASSTHKLHGKVFHLKNQQY